jgi:uncharacterized protein
VTPVPPTDPLRASATGCFIDLRVLPRAPTDAVGGLRGGRLLVRVTAPPVDHAANDAVRRVLAGALGVSASAITLVSGRSARNKTVEVRGVSPDAVRQRLGDAAFR